MPTDGIIFQVVNSFFRETECFIGPGVSDYEFIKYQTSVLGSGFLDLDDTDKMEHPWDYVRKMPHQNREDYMKKHIIDSDKSGKLTIEYICEFIELQNQKVNLKND